MKPHIIAILPVFWGRSCDSPYQFLHVFCKIFRAHKRPVGSSEDDYRLKALTFGNTWFMRLPPNSIRTWSNFKMMILDEFFPAAKTSALSSSFFLLDYMFFSFMPSFDTPFSFFLYIFLIFIFYPFSSFDSNFFLLFVSQFVDLFLLHLASVICPLG